MGPFSISNKPEVRDMLEHREALDDMAANIGYCRDYGNFNADSRKHLQKMQQERKAEIKALELDLIAEYSQMDISEVWKHEEMNAPEKLYINKDFI